MHAEIVEKWCAALSLDTIEDLCVCAPLNLALQTTDVAVQCQFVDVFVGDVSRTLHCISQS